MAAADASSAPGEGGHTAVAVLVQRNLWPYLVGNTLSMCGTWFQNIAQAILVYRLTRSTFLVGVVSFAQFAGVFVLAPWAGSAADRYDRKRLLVVTQLGAMAVTGLLAALEGAGLVNAPIVIGLALVLGLTTAFAIPAQQALVPALVDIEDLAPAVVLNSLTFNLARAIGPVVGALVVGALGIGPAFALNSLSYAALIAGLLFVHPRAVQVRTVERPRLRESARLVRADPRLRALLVTVAALSLAQDPVTTLTPAFATDVLHRSDTLTGWLVGVFGLGSVLAIGLASRREGLERRMPVTAFLLGVAMVAFALSTTLLPVVVALLAGGFCFLATNTGATTLVQLEVAEEQRGRVMAIWTIAFLGTRPVGSVIDGALASATSVHVAGLVMALPAFAAAAVLATTVHRGGSAPAR
jgi:MFS family permease